MAYGVIYGTKSWKIGGNPIAYTERASLTTQPKGTIEVPDGDGVIKWRKNWGFFHRIDGSFVMIDDAQYAIMRAHMLADDYILLDLAKDSDTAPASFHFYLDSQTKESLAGDGGPQPEKFTLSGRAYPSLDAAGEHVP